MTQSKVSGVDLEVLKTDFTLESFPKNNFDGILIANALHYVENKTKFIEELKKTLKSSGSLIIIEYETEHSNPWVPYPIPFISCKDLFIKAGYSSIRKVGKRPSRSGYKNIYCCLIE
jgi:ubiquinone/menaquinone biosynthesis C-methylase UbiE